MSQPITTREIEYTANGQRFIGYFAAPAETTTPVAGVVIGPEWWGRNGHVEQRARELAEHGFAALALDMYSDKKVTHAASQASEWMQQLLADPDAIVNRAQAGLDALIAQPEVDATKLAAIGFCFGGKVALDLARSGADLKAVAAFHATLTPKVPAEKGKFKAEVVVLHGELDSMVSMESVEQFREEMQAAEVKHEIMVLKDAKHGFTNVEADAHGKENGIDLGYNADAERQGFAAMYALFDKRLK